MNQLLSLTDSLICPPRLSDASGAMTFTEAASGTVRRSSLNSDDVFVFDTGNSIYVWIGKGASTNERAR